MFGFSYDTFLNGDICVGNDRLLKVTLTEQKCMVVNFVKELIQLRDGILGFSHASTLSRRDLKMIIDHVITAIV